jgi:hypothetical protein
MNSKWNLNGNTSKIPGGIPDEISNRIIGLEIETDLRELDKENST